MDHLSFVDELRQPVQASGDAVWAAMLRVLRRTMSNSPRFVRFLACDPATGTADFAGRPGETLPGFRVEEAEPGRRLVLRGRHRFAHYQLTVVLDGGVLRVATHAEFAGVRGRLYRAAVIGSGAHRIVVRRILRRIARASLTSSSSRHE